jgi:serralysin
VWNAKADAETHYNAFGWHEGRDPDAFFSTSTYLTANADMQAAGVNPLDHWHTFGWTEGRVPSIDFDPRRYLAANPDVAVADANPLTHFLRFGIH